MRLLERHTNWTEDLNMFIIPNILLITIVWMAVVLYLCVAVVSICARVKCAHDASLAIIFMWREGGEERREKTTTNYFNFDANRFSKARLINWFNLRTIFLPFFSAANLSQKQHKNIVASIKTKSFLLFVSFETNILTLCETNRKINIQNERRVTFP